jgi:N12 class adenine-specific DNA methylase
MARKYERISELYDQTVKEIYSNPDLWRSFLRSASNNFKLRFDEQVLVFAQKPEATAVLEINRWNRLFGRWVNRGATGIAVFEDLSGESQRLNHYFDISDTHTGEKSRPVPLWKMKSDYENEVIDTLESTFGELENTSTITNAIISAAENAVEDNIPDYTGDLLHTVDNSFLEDLPDESITAIYRQLVTNSVAYMIMTRLDLNPDLVLDDDDFRDVVNFNTKDTLNFLGFATSDISEMALSEVARTVIPLERKNRTFVKSQSEEYTETEKETERSFDYEGNIHTAGRLQTPEPDSPRTADGTARTLRENEAEIPQGESQSNLLQLSDERNADAASRGYTAESRTDGGTFDNRDGSEAEHNREAESREPDDVGRLDEQSPTDSTGNNTDGSDIRINSEEQAQSNEPASSVIDDDRFVSGDTNFNVFDEKGEFYKYPFFGVDEVVNEIFATTPHLKASLEEIRGFYEAYTDEDRRIEYIKDIFNNDFTELILSDDTRVGYKTYENGVLIWKGRYPKREGQSFLHWDDVAGHFEAMRKLGMLHSRAKPLPSVEGQLQIISEEAGHNAPAFSFPQEIIDAALTRGSNVYQSKMRIYDHFQKSLSQKENIAFLKNEYGWGGSSSAVPYTGVGEMHNGKGIELSIGFGEKTKKQMLKWNYVEKRIRELIKLDRYLNPKEKVYYPTWLDKQEQKRAERAAELERNKILSTAPQEEMPPVQYEYRYSLGARVYIGSSEYEINSFDDERVMLFDRNFPLFNKEMTRTEFDEKVKENPMNNHLRFVIDPADEKSEPESKLKKTEEPIRDYQQIKAENPDRIVLYRMGDFYEVMGDDAPTVSNELDVRLMRRLLSDGEHIPMCGFPADKLQINTDMLLDRGHDILLAATENDEIKLITLNSDSKEEPRQSTMIARVEYFKSNGEVDEVVEYSSEYSFKKDVQEQASVNLPMNISLFKNKDGEVVDHNFLDNLKSVQSVEILDYQPNISEYDVLLDKAKKLIDEYMESEFNGDDFEFPEDLSEINLAYTTTDDEKHILEGGINLVDYQIYTTVDGKTVRTEQYDSLEDIVENGLQGLTFNDLVYVSDEELAPFYDEQQKSEQQQPEKEVLKPTWEQKPRERVRTFDLHPDIPMAERNTFDLKNFELEAVGKKARFQRNIEAIRILKECEFDNRFATPEEQQVLAQYVGWGGIPEAFDENNNSWTDEYFELNGLLSPDEYTSARESTLTAFYTPPVVISAIYNAMEQLGFKEGNILEPSCGIGNFIGMLPDSMNNSRVYGVEIDKITAGIAQQLYQKSSIAAQPFEKASIPDSFFDAVVGNVPFGDFKVLDKRYDKHNFLIHDYFFAKSLDKLRPGGVMALVTSSGTMDKENPAVRKYIAQRADLLGAIRLPNNTFKGNAGTEVVSDILILQKRDRLIDIEPEWVHLNTDENGFKMNSYFVDHPEMILGEIKMVSGRFGPELTCESYENADLEALLDEAISNIHGEITAYEIDDDLEEDNSIPADPSVRNFSYTEVEGVIYFRENSRMQPVEASATAENRIKGLINIRDSVRNLIEFQTENYSDEVIKQEQNKLNTLYDSFTKKYGLINSRANKSAFSQDSSFSLLSALEILDDDGKLKRKADMFFKRTIKPHTPVTSVDSASEALAISIGEKARIDMEYMQELTGKSENEIFDELKGVIFLNPLYESENETVSKYLTADEYLSGNVREKLTIAKKSAELHPEEYNINVQALEKVQPKDLTASEISVRLGATWIPPEIYEQFIYEFLSTPVYMQHNIKVNFSQYTGQWNIEGKSYDRSGVKAHKTYGTGRINAYKIIEETLNLKDVRVIDYVEEADGKKTAVLNKKETAIALSKQELIKQGFQDWIWKDQQRRERLCKIYNEKFNSLRPREYDGSHLVFSGMNPEIQLREHQRNAIAHIIYGGNTLLAHCVGAGKTFEMVAAAMESKRLGLCSKSLFVVPNHITEQWAAEFLQLYPSANILVATKKDFQTKNRKRFCGRIATGDYDAVIIGHSQFEKIPMSVERQRAILEQQLEEIVDGIRELKAKRGDNFSVKQLEQSKKSIKVKLDKLNDQSRKDDVVTFEELGVDRLFIDESHYYKNLYLYTKMRNVGGIAQTEAQKSSDLFMKCRYLDEITGGRGTVFATGTPISNSMVELYTIQRYLQYDTLARNGLQLFDSWASTFGETVTAIELTPEGSGYRPKTRFAKFFNLPELMAMFKEVADIKTADMLNLPVPEAHYDNVAVKPSDVQKDMVKSLSERAEKVRNRMVQPEEDNMLKITNDGRKLALDQRMINPMLPDYEGSKVNACADNIYKIWLETTEKKSAQLVFCDLSTPKPDAEFSVYYDIRKKLIERGVPESEVRFIHEANTEVKKRELFQKTRKGEVRILMGSTQKMGAGTNVQDKLIAMHDLDCPWRPSDLQQRAGRIVRQGNENSDVHIYRYVTEQTFDAYLYQLVEGKQKFASQIMTSKSPVRSAEDIDATALSYAEVKMLATGNPYIKEKMDLDIQVQKLNLLKSNYLSEKYELEDRIVKFYPQEISRLTARIQGVKKDIETAKAHPKEKDGKFVGMIINDYNYNEKAEAGELIIEACKGKTSPEPSPLGEYRGFKTELLFDTFAHEYKVNIKGAYTHTVSLGTDVYGNITRMDHVIDGLESTLEDYEEALADTKSQFETAKVEVEKPFAQEDELKQKNARLNELNALLSVDKHEPEFVGGEPDTNDMPSQSNRLVEQQCR